MVFKGLGSVGEPLAEDAVRKYVGKFNRAGSISGVVHLHEHLQLLHKREFLINNPKVLEMAKKITDGMRRPRSNSTTSSGVHPAPSPTPRRAEPLFSKPVVYHASVCCRVVNKCAHNDCSKFFMDASDGHSFKEVSISQSEGRYLIATQNSTYYIAFQAEPNIAQWPEKYKSFSEGIIILCLVLHITHICTVYSTQNLKHQF